MGLYFCCFIVRFTNKASHVLECGIIGVFSPCRKKRTLLGPGFSAQRESATDSLVFCNLVQEELENSYLRVISRVLAGRSIKWKHIKWHNLRDWAVRFRISWLRLGDSDAHFEVRLPIKNTTSQRYNPSWYQGSPTDPGQSIHVDWAGSPLL